MADALTPAQWRDKLRAELAKRAADIAICHRYYEGDHPLPTAPDVRNESYRRLAHLAQLNLTGLVVDAVSERLEVNGITLGTGADRKAANDIWLNVWQANDLDAWSSTVHDEALIARRAFALVWPDGDGTVSITPELPTEVVVAYRPGARPSPSNAVAALKEYVDAGRRYTVLWLPDEVHYWQAGETGSKWKPWPEGGGLDPELEGEEWAVIDTAAVAANPLGRCPVVEFLAKPDVAGKPRGELTTGVRRIQDRVNKTLLDRLVAAEFTAYPQRYALGLDPEDANGQPRKLTSGPERAWIFEDDNVKIGQLAAGDLKPYLESVAADIEAMAAITKTPVYYLASAFANVGADTIVAVDAGLVKKARAHQRTFGEAWEQVVRLALAALDDERASDVGLQIGWSDPEVRTRAELGDWAIKVRDIIPIEDVWEGLGASPQDIDRMTRAIAERVVADRGLGQVDPEQLAVLAQKLYLAVPSILTPDEARDIMRAAGAELDEFEPPAAA